MRGHAGDVGSHCHEILGAHPRREQRLVGVAERGLGHREGGLGAQGGGETDRAEFEQTLPGTDRRGLAEIDVRQLQGRVEDACTIAVRAVDRDIREPIEDLGAAVLRLVGVEEIRAFLDESGAEVASLKRRIVEHGLKEGNVGGDASDAELGESALRPRHRCREVTPAAGHLHEH